ncbi:peptidyl-prolyl cis-trans isomerase [Thermosipho sp. (in: thermotogales)]|jgi:parvulin-like peptidyl-prolyl isomerase|uniref:peptidyl-prolyl cis-trans isomerase n=1 Tax=Thermosipho sp. (in: thermotogales) TaxID=1968895 RepID=UPI00257A19D4|nr:peptidyl-prolyl cis-trans isomerase [Thermosipho sp. (in: thermotogales)]MBZ4650908.1 putative basic rane protein [Thermosipho sp. (in: thermotogales)]
MKRFLLLLLVVFSVVIFSEELPATSTVAVVNGEAITLEQLNRAADVQKLMIGISQVDQTFFSVLSNTEEGVKVILRYKRVVLDDLVNKLLIVQFAQKYGARPTEEEVKNVVDKQISDYLNQQGIDEKTFDMYLQYANMGTLEDFKEKMYFETLVNLSLERLFNVVTKDATVSDEELMDYYQKHIDEYSTPTQYTLSLIAFDNEKVANAVKTKIISGETFDSIASEYGISQFKYENIAENTTFPDKLWNYIKNAPQGALLGPIDVDEKYYIFKVENVNPMQSKKFDEVREEISNMILSEKKKNMWANFIDSEFSKFKNESTVEVYYKVDVEQKN